MGLTLKQKKEVKDFIHKNFVKKLKIMYQIKH